MQIYELKLRIDRSSEKEIVQRLNLAFIKEYKDTDTYLKDENGVILKIKDLGKQSIFYEIHLTQEHIFDIQGTDVTESERAEIIKEHPITKQLHRTKRMYGWNKFSVKCSFDYIDEFPSTLFLEVHSDSRESVLKAKENLSGLGFIDIIKVGYNQL